MSEENTSIALQKLSPKHKEVVSLICQGVRRADVASITGFVPEYITWLMRQEVCKEYLKEVMAVVDFRLLAMTEQSVDAIQEVLQDGAGEERLKAAKLQLEAVGRIGAGKNGPAPSQVGPEHLDKLAERLVSLLKTQRTGETFDVEAKVVQE